MAMNQYLLPHIVVGTGGEGGGGGGHWGLVPPNIFTYHYNEDTILKQSVFY